MKSLIAGHRKITSHKAKNEKKITVPLMAESSLCCAHRRMKKALVAAQATAKKNGNQKSCVLIFIAPTT
jgi:hypothetical protein